MPLQSLKQSGCQWSQLGGARAMVVPLVALEVQLVALEVQLVALEVALEGKCPVQLVV